MEQVFIVSGVRTAIGAFGGALSKHPPCDLATLVAAEAIARAGIKPAAVDQSVFGNVLHSEARDMYLARVAAMEAGIPETAPALTLNRLCGSGMQAVVSAAEAIQLGHASVALAGGAESMSRAGHLFPTARFGQRLGNIAGIDMVLGVLEDPFGHGHMGLTAENVADSHGIDRDTQDEFAAGSHRRAAAAIDAGHFKSQILGVTVYQGRKESTFEIDEHVRRDVTRESLAGLKPVFRPGGTVTAGNSSGINDGAAALVLMSEPAMAKHGATPLGRIVSTGLAGVAPERMGLGPIPAVGQALERAGLKVGDIEVIESNEAFAAQACAVARDLGLPPELTNPNGGAVAMGHPIGASGAIILIKLLYELQRRGGRYGLATMCIGGGQGIAMVVENTEA